MKYFILIIVCLIIIYAEINHWTTTRRLEAIERKLDETQKTVFHMKMYIENCK